MATTDELLASLSESTPEHTHNVSDSDTYFIINPITRQVVNTASTKNVLMQFDHDSERFTFELPRYVENHDMTLCNVVKVHYNNLDSETDVENTGVYDVTDLAVDPENPNNVICSWLISRNATQLIGPLSFIVQYACVTDGELVYEWHSDIYYDIEVKAGRNNGDSSVSQYSDVLEQWRESLFGAADSAVTEIESARESSLFTLNAAKDAHKDEIEAKAEEVLATIPEDYTTTHEMADEALRKKANAIICSENDEVILLDDSSDCNLLGLNIYGKTTQVRTNGYQLFDASKINSRTMGKASITNNGDGSFTIANNSQGDDVDFLYYYDYTHEQTLALISKAGTYNLRTEKATSPYVYVAFSIGGSFLYELQCRSSASSSLQITETMLNDSTFYMRIGFYGFSSTATTPAVIRPMLYVDGDGGWELFTGGIPGPNPDYPIDLDSISGSTTFIHGKNLVEPKANSIYGYKSVVNPDGSITVTGAANSTEPIYIMMTTVSDDNPLILHEGVNYCMYGESTSEVKIGVKSVMEGGLLEWTIIDDWNRLVGSKTTKRSINQFFLESTGHTIGDTRLCGTYKIQLEANDEKTTFDSFKPRQTMSIARTLNGISVSQNGNYIDSNGQQWTCDEIDFERGKFIQRCGYYIFDGSEDEDWLGIHAHDSKRYVSIEVPPGNDVYTTRTICNYSQNGAWGKDVVCFIDNSKRFTVGGPQIIGEQDTVATFREKIAAQPIELTYVLGTPIEYDLTSTELQAFRALTTNATNTTILNDQNARMSVKYVADLERYIHKNVTVKEVSFDLTLVEANWVPSSDERYYTQVIDYIPRSTGRISLNPSAAQQVSLILDGIAMFIANENGVATAYCISSTPGRDITIPASEQVVVFE